MHISNSLKSCFNSEILLLSLCFPSLDDPSVVSSVGLMNKMFLLLDRTIPNWRRSWNRAHLTLATWFQSRSCSPTSRRAPTGPWWAAGTVRLLGTVPPRCSSCLMRISPIADEPQGSYQWKLPVSTWMNPNPTEDWDKGILPAAGCLQQRATCLWPVLVLPQRLMIALLHLCSLPRWKPIKRDSLLLFLHLCWSVDFNWSFSCFSAGPQLPSENPTTFPGPTEEFGPPETSSFTLNMHARSF